MLDRARAFWSSKHPATLLAVGLLLVAAALEALPDSRWASSAQLALLVGAIPLAFRGLSEDRARSAKRAAADDRDGPAARP